MIDHNDALLAPCAHRACRRDRHRQRAATRACPARATPASRARRATSSPSSTTTRSPAGLAGVADRRLRRPGVIGAGGVAVPRWETGEPAWFPDEFAGVVGCTYRGLPEQRAPIRNPIGANMSFRRAAFDEAGGFRTASGASARPRWAARRPSCRSAFGRQRWGDDPAGARRGRRPPRPRRARALGVLPLALLRRGSVQGAGHPTRWVTTRAWPASARTRRARSRPGSCAASPTRCAGTSAACAVLARSSRAWRSPPRASCAARSRVGGARRSGGGAADPHPGAPLSRRARRAGRRAGALDAFCGRLRRAW